MIIDSHQHFWIYNPVRDAWIDESMLMLRKNFLPEELEPILIKHSIDGTIAVQADQSEVETEFLLSLAKENDWIFGVVGWIDLKAKNIEKRLEYFSSFPVLKGFRHIVQAEPDPDFMLNEKFQNGISSLKQFNYTYDILVYPHQLPASIKLSEKHNEQKFVLDHIAKPLIIQNKIEPWASYIKELAKNPNVYCKVSGMVTEADYNNWKPEDFYPYLDIIFESFGIERIMFGSDYPVCLLAGSYGQVLNIVKKYTADIFDEDKEKIWSKNSLSFYNIKTDK